MNKRPLGISFFTKRKAAANGSKNGKGTPGGKSAPRGKSGRTEPPLEEQLLAIIANGAVWGVLLVLLGVLTFIALLSTNGAVTGWWVDQLTALFGIGRYLMPILFVGAGLYLFLRSSGHSIDIGVSQVVGLTLLWMAFQATAHLLGVGDGGFLSTPNSSGGLMGWAISQGLILTVGADLAILFLLFLGAIGLVLVLGITLDQLVGGATLAARAVIDFITALPQRLRGEPDALGKSRSPWERLRAWVALRRRAGAEARSGYEDLEGPITTLPPDPTPPRPHAAATLTPPPPVMRIIGGDSTAWRLPEVTSLLEDIGVADISEEDLAERARVIEDTLEAFGVPVTVIEVNKGPAVTQFGLKPEYITRKVRGEEKRVKVRVSQIQALSNDLSLALAASPIRIEAPVPGRNIVGLEVPNRNIAMVSLRSVLESEEFERLKAPLRIALGQDVSGHAVAASLARMPHLLVAGATGSGKSVCINAIICSLMFQYTPDQLRFVMVDPKRVELTGYNGIPHLIDSVVTDIEKVTAVLHWATTEMDRRYKDFEKAGARNIDVYNARRQADGKSIMPYIVVIIDELADIMMMAPEEVEKSLVRLAQMARATGIHLIIATQRPSVNVVTGLIKANFPSRIAFAVTSQIDSRVILDTPGAERLLGRGDMLFMRPDSAKLARLQGAFVSDAEVVRIVRYWRGQGTSPLGGIRPLTDSPDLMDDEPSSTLGAMEPPTQRPLWDDLIAQAEQESGRDVLYKDAVTVVRESGRASTSLLQRRLRIGYSRAARLIEMMEDDGIVGPDLGGSRGREVLPPSPGEGQVGETDDILASDFD